MTRNLPESFQCTRCASLCNMIYSAVEKADFLCNEFYVELAIEMFVSGIMNLWYKTYHLTGLVRNIRWFKTDVTQRYFLTSMMHDITYTKALPNVITFIMHDITCTRALAKVITCLMHDITSMRAFPNHMKCMMYDTTCSRALRNVITCTGALPNVMSCIMHVTSFGTALMHVISCYACYACYNIRESSRACYIMHHACSNIRKSSCAFYIMHVKKYFCVMSLLNHRRNRSSHFTFAIANYLFQ